MTHRASLPAAPAPTKRTFLATGLSGGVLLSGLLLTGWGCTVPVEDRESSLDVGEELQHFRICGRKMAPCPEDMFCRPEPPCTRVDLCGGTCVPKNTYSPCGGIKGIPCDHGFTCENDPRIPDNNCDPQTDADCLGICVRKNAPKCGGFTGRACPKGLYCYDAPREGCVPKKKGANCMGICL